MPAAARSFWSDAARMGTGQAVYVLCQWGMLIVLARLGGPAMVGQFALALAVTAPIMLFSNLALRAAIVTDVRGEHSIQRYVALRLTTAALGLLAIAGLVIAMPLADGTGLLMLAVGLAKAFENVSDLLYGIDQRQERFDLIALSMSARGVLGLLGFALAIWSTGNLVAGALTTALVWGAVLILFDWPATAAWRRSGGSAGDPRCWLRLAGQVLPLGVAAALISLNSNLPRYVIAQRLGDAELGIFAALSCFVIAGTMLITVLGQTASVRLAHAGASGDRNAYTRLLAGMVAVGVALGAAGILAAALGHRQIIAWFYGAAFVDASHLLVPMMIVALVRFVGSCLGFGATALRIFRPAPLIQLAALAANGAGCVLLIGYGVAGIIVAWMVALLVHALGHLLLIVGHWRRSAAPARRAAPPQIAQTSRHGGGMTAPLGR